MNGTGTIEQHSDPYMEFLHGKSMSAAACGFDVDPTTLHPAMFPFQRDIAAWGLRKGRCAVFAGTGMGKTLIYLSWGDQVAQHTNRPVLILAPLAVARQTVEEGKKFGFDVTYVRDDVHRPPLSVTNYEIADRIDPSLYGAVVPDESSILKALSSKTRQDLTDRFAMTPYKNANTATPAPNDIVEIINHAEFLNVMNRGEMLASFFVNGGKTGDSGDGWRLKKHAAAGPFYEHMASWSMSIRKPSDLGYEDDGFALPSLTITPHVIEVDLAAQDRLFQVGIHGVGEYARVRHSTLDDRVRETADLVGAEPDRQWLIWCDFNDEDEALCKAIPKAVSVRGSDTPEEKADKLMAFAHGAIDRLVSKPSIAGFGMNFQTCDRQAFCGLSFSWESYYQAIRRSWRFGQRNPVNVHVVISSAELPIWNAVQRKESEANMMAEELVKRVAAYERKELGHVQMRGEYSPSISMKLPTWLKEIPA